MDLMIGGYAAGKLQAALDKLNSEGIDCKDILIIDENTDFQTIEAGNYGAVIINHLHLILKNTIKDEVRNFIDIIQKKNSRVIVISDEIGNGIIPLEKKDREYRDECGNFLIELAKEAVSVERVICQIVQKIK